MASADAKGKGSADAKGRGRGADATGRGRGADTKGRGRGADGAANATSKTRSFKASAEALRAFTETQWWRIGDAAEMELSRTRGRPNGIRDFKCLEISSKPFCVSSSLRF